MSLLEVGARPPGTDMGRGRELSAGPEAEGAEAPVKWNGLDKENPTATGSNGVH